MATNTPSRTLDFNSGKVLSLKRTWQTNPEVSAPSRFFVGSGGVIPNVNSTSIGTRIPINDGDVLDNFGDTSGWSVTGGSVSVNETRFVKGTSAMNITKDDDTTSTVTINKTFSAFSLDDNKLFLFLYFNGTVINVLNTVTIRLEEDASNYYEKNVDVNSLVNAWNFVRITSDDTVVGTPDINNLETVRVTFTTDDDADVWSDGDVVIDEIKVVTPNDFIKQFVGGFPQINEGAKELLVRGQLNSTQANGFIIDRWGVENTDETPILVLCDTFPGESKTQSDEFSFIRKNVRI